MVAKVAGGIIGLGLIGTGSVAMAKPEWFGINKEITWKPLSQDSDFSDASNGYTSKFGGNHKNYLVGVKGNQGWWKESFERLKRDSKNPNTNEQPSSKFKYTNDNGTVTNGFVASGGNDENKALNQICKKAYKSESGNIDATGTSNDRYKEADVWKYCSGLGEKPKTVAEVDTGKYNDSTKTLIGKETSDRQKLISTTGNNKFWEIRDKEFKGDGYEKIETTEDKFFSASKNKDIRTLCEEAYGLEATSTSESEVNKPKKEQVLKYCSLDKSTQ